jgi:hypothetical protein
MRSGVMIVLVAVALGGCGGGSNDPASTGGSPPSDEQSVATAEARAVCSFYSPAQVAQRLKLEKSASDEEIAKAFAEAYGVESRDAAFAGCLDGLSLTPLRKP